MDAEPPPSGRRALRGSLAALLLWLAAATVALMVAVNAVGSVALSSSILRMERDDVNDRVTRVRSFMERLGADRAATVREYAWWTETWDFIDHPRTAAAAAFIEDNFVGWLPRQYGDRLIGIYDRQGRRVFLWADSALRGAESAFEAPALLGQVERVRAAGGLLATPRGLVLAGHSVVVRTDDQTAQGPSHGFVVLALPVTDSLQHRWGESLHLGLRLEPVGDTAAFAAESVRSRRTAGGDSVDTRFLVRDLVGAPVAVAVVSESRAAVAALRRSALMAMGTVALIALALIVVIWTTAHRALVRPLQQVAAELGRMRSGAQLAPLAAPAGGAEWSLFVGTFNETVGALSESEERYTRIFRQAADALFVVEGDEERIVDVNPAGERLAGRGRDALLGRSLREYLAPAPQPAGKRGDCRWRRGEGDEIPVEVLVGAAGSGQRPLRLASVRDLTERLDLETQLREAQKLEVLGRLAGGIAHDFNNLLGAVLVSAGSLREEVGAQHSGIGSIETIERAAKRAAELTLQLLSFARRDPPRREPVPAHDIVASVRRLCGRTFSHSVELVARLDAPGAAVLGDAGQLEQAVLNLCLNARDAMPSGGVVTLGARTEEVDEAAARRQPGLAPGPHVVLSVADTGRGIPPEVAEHLFEPFFTTKERGKGTGLGLATAYGIARAHGGAITVRSEPGKGACFEIWLPRCTSEAEVETAAGEKPALPGGHETILVVDDEDSLRRSLRHALTRIGYQVLEAANGRQALALFAEHEERIDLVLLDVRMPEMGGVETFKALRSRWPHVCVLVTTGYTSGDEFEELVAAGADGVLMKPCELSDLAATIRRVLDRSTQERSPA